MIEVRHRQSKGSGCRYAQTVHCSRSPRWRLIAQALHNNEVIVIGGQSLGRFSHPSPRSPQNSQSRGATRLDYVDNHLGGHHLALSARMGFLSCPPIAASDRVANWWLETYQPACLEPRGHVEGESNKLCEVFPVGPGGWRTAIRLHQTIDARPIRDLQWLVLAYPD